MLQGIKAIALLTVFSGFPTWAQDITPGNSAQTKTETVTKPSGDAMINTLVPLGVNPKIPNSATTQTFDTSRPATTGQPVTVPQRNFNSQRSNPASPTNDPINSQSD